MSCQPSEGDWQGIQECRGRTHGNQHIHVRRPIAQGFERAYVILPPHIELDRQGKRQHEPVCPGGRCGTHTFHGCHFVERSRQQVEVTCHGKEEQRHCEDQANNEEAALFIDLKFACLGFGILCLPTELNCLESCRN